MAETKSERAWRPGPGAPAAPRPAATPGKRAGPPNEGAGRRARYAFACQTRLAYARIRLVCGQHQHKQGDNHPQNQFRQRQRTDHATRPSSPTGIAVKSRRNRRQMSSESWSSPIRNRRQMRRNPHPWAASAVAPERSEVRRVLLCPPGWTAADARFPDARRAYFMLCRRQERIAFGVSDRGSVSFHRSQNATV